MFRSLRALTAAALVLSAAPLAAAVVPAGGELPVSPNVAWQKQPAAAVVAAGYVLAWEDAPGIQVRWFDDTGRPSAGTRLLAVTDPLPPLPFSNVYQRQAVQPALATRGDGSFLLAWTEEVYLRSADIFYDQRQLVSSRVLSRLYAADGRPLARTWEVSDGAELGSRPAVISNGNGFWVAWQERGTGAPGIHLRRLDNRGRVGAEVHVAEGAGVRPSLAVSGNRVLVAWMEGADVRARLFDSAANPVGDAFVLAAGQPRPAAAPAVAAQPDGEFVVAFQRAIAAGPQKVRVYAQRVSQQGSLLGRARTINGDTGDAYNAPRIVALPGGRWLVSWFTWVGRFRVGIEGAWLDADLDADDRFLLNERSIGAQFDMALHASRDGRIAAAWEGYDEHGKRGLRTRAFTQQASGSRRR